MSNAVKNIMQPSWNHALVTFNNQDSVLMSMSVPEHKLSCLLHDNRIFAFEREQASDDASSSSNEQNVLLNLLTTPKYRAMSAMYIIFRLLDNISFLLIIVLSIMNVDFTIPTPAEYALLSTIGLEVFYDVMLYTHKYWILQRLSIYIGIVLYGAYYGVVAWKNSHGEYKPDENKLDEYMPGENDLFVVIVILSIRFVAFIFEECVDIAIDGELHNDLLKLQKYKEKNEKEKQRKESEDDQKQDKNTPLVNTIDKNTPLIKIIDENTPLVNTIDENTPLINTIDENTPSENTIDEKHTYSWWSKFKSYIDVTIAVKMPQNVDYRGSFFAWSQQSVFTENVWTKDQFPRWLVYTLCFLPFIVASILSLLIILLCLVASFIPVILFMLICVVITIKSVFTKMVWTGDQFPNWLVYILRCLVYTLYIPPFFVALILSLLLILLCLVASLIPLILFVLIYAAVAIYYLTCNPGKLKKKMMSSNFWKELTHFFKELTHF